MGLFTSRKSAAANQPPAAQSSTASTSKRAEPPAYDSGKAPRVEVSALDTEPFIFEQNDSPFAVTLTFACPKPVIDRFSSSYVSESRKLESADDRNIDVSLSIPKSAVNTGINGTQDKTCDIYFFLEYPGNELTSVHLEAVYEAVADNEPMNAEKPGAKVKQPWSIGGSLAAEIINRSVDLEAKGRFTSKATWTIRLSLDRGKSPVPIFLDHHPRAICATSTFYGPFLVSLRVGVSFGKWAHSEPIHDKVEQSKVHWQEISRKLLFTGNRVDYVTPYIATATQTKLLGA